MKKILLKSIPYLIGFLIINLICYKSSNFFAKESEYVGKIESSISSKNEVLFLGDSHSETIKLLNLDQNVGNLAFGADGVREMYVKSLITLEKNPKAKYVFISTEPQIFNNSLSSNSSFLNPYLLTITDSLNVYDKDKLDLLVEKVPLFNDSYLKYYLNNIFLSVKTFKNGKEEKDWEGTSDKAKREIATQTGKIDHNAILTNENDTLVFRKTIDLYKSRNIKVIGIRFPVYAEYMAQCDQNDLEQVDRFVQSLNLDYNLDYSSTIKDPSLFADEDHLNKEGITLLSKHIYEDTGVKLSK